MRKLVFVLVLLILFCSCGAEPVYEEPVGINSLPWSDMSRKNNERPIIMIGGELYYFDDYIGIRGLPEEYSEIGEIVPVADKIPEKDFEILCKDEFSGKVFAGNETNTTIYIVLDDDEEYCIRFACEKMMTNPNMVGHNSIIYYGGRLYEHNYSLGGESYTDEVPEGFEPVGELEYIGINNIPQNDLETNCKMDNYSSSVDGREVYANPGDSSVIYVFNIEYWSKGSYTNYLRCEAFEE